MSAKNANEFLRELRSLVAELRKYQAEVNSVKRSVSVNTALKTKKEETLKALDARIGSEEKSLSETLVNVYQSMLKFGRYNDSSYKGFAERLNDIRENFANIDKAGKVTKSQKMSFDGLVKTIDGALNTISYDVKSTDLWMQIADNYANRQEEIEFNQSMYVSHYDSLKELLSVKLQKVAEYNKESADYKARIAKSEEVLKMREEEKMEAEIELKGLNLESLKKEAASIPVELTSLKETDAKISASIADCDSEIARLTSLLGDDTDDLTDEQINIDILSQQEKLQVFGEERAQIKVKSKELSERLAYVNAAISNFRVILVKAQDNLKAINEMIAKEKSELSTILEAVKLSEANFTVFMSDMESDVTELFAKISELTQWLEDATRGVELAIADNTYNSIDSKLTYADRAEAVVSKIKRHPFGDAWFKFKQIQLGYVILTDSFEIADAVKVLKSAESSLEDLQMFIAIYNKSNEEVYYSKEKNCESLYILLEELSSYGQELEYVNKRIAEIEALMSAGVERTSELELNLASYEETLQSLKAESQQLNSSLSAAQEAIALLDPESVTYADDLAALEAEVASINSSLEANATKTAENKALTSECQSEIESIKAESESLKSEKESLDAQKDQASLNRQDVLDRLNQGVDMASSKLASVKGDLSNAEVNIKKNESILGDFNNYMSTNPWDTWFMYEEKVADEPAQK